MHDFAPARERLENSDCPASPPDSEASDADAAT